MTDEQRHPDHGRVKARILKAWTDCIGPEHPGREPLFDALAAEAIRLGARAPDPREKLIRDIAAKLKDWKCQRSNWDAEKMATVAVNYVLDNAPKEG